jgi:hypothetical protein
MKEQRNNIEREKKESIICDPMYEVPQSIHDIRIKRIQAHLEVQVESKKEEECERR